ncbi:hypothetical protein VFPFJ_05262 [Purpureocillium lilacinum]|uniref:Uncharacterized protein n=1 Tax=Purpureocillium lilacinum TaxID=33203 RepID=A0A179HP31_PURLI|nr:hypothetical protein VFPFJ_05262 [Purpureocillium lilacinum]OAQ84314.1 hypothetical protein VFPBJ_03082 [Purpureocillium lilacinum]OAQ91103.1 hypothetical protein VFPFJ_05262 [Purpureocillium lilacinum]
MRLLAPSGYCTWASRWAGSSKAGQPGLRASSARTRQGMALWHPKGPICRRDAVGQRAALRASEKGKMTSCAFMRGGRPANPGEPSSSQSATAA